MLSLTVLKPIRAVVIAVVVSLGAVSASFGQFNPDAGQWGKDDPTHVRVMTWNMKDGICSTNIKTAARPNWAGIVRIIADLQPDVILMQETGGNAGNGTGTGLDSAANLVTTIGLLIRGGADPFNGGNVGIYVQQFAPDYDLPYVFASGDADGFNRNIIVSRWPFADLNNSGFSTMSNFTILPSLYAEGGNGGIRGFMTAEIDLPDDVYAGDLVVGNSHLKCCGTASDRAERLKAAQNIAYFIDYYFNGAGTGMVDPLNRVFLPVINRAAMNVLDENTPVIWGGDWNEDENTNNRRGPALWMTQAAIEGGPTGRTATAAIRCSTTRVTFSYRPAARRSGAPAAGASWTTSRGRIRSRRCTVRLSSTRRRSGFSVVLIRRRSTLRRLRRAFRGRRATTGRWLLISSCRWPMSLRRVRATPTDRAR